MRLSRHSHTPRHSPPLTSPLPLYRLRYELQQQEYALSQGSQQHLTYFNQQRGRLRALELRAYAQIDARYNGLLRRLSGCGTVLGACAVPTSAGATR